MRVDSTPERFTLHQRRPGIVTGSLSSSASGIDTRTRRATTRTASTMELSQLTALPMHQQAAAVTFIAYVAYRVLRWTYRRLLTLACMSPIPYGARAAAPLIVSYSLEGDAYFSADGCSQEIALKRKQGADKLAKRFDALTGPKGKRLNETLISGLSDIRFTDTNRVPVQFQKETRKRYQVAAVTSSSKGCVLIDVDGGQSIDVSGSYGVNVCGYDQYKQFVERGWARIKDLGPNVLGPVHPIISDVLPKLKKISNKEEVSFHMSGTEAVMCAIRLCRFNTRRKLIVQFSGAYHGADSASISQLEGRVDGVDVAARASTRLVRVVSRRRRFRAGWWDGVQPGPGSERANSDVLYLKDMHPTALKCIAARSDEIACVCVSPLQGLNPGSPPPSDLVLLDAKVRKTAEKGNAYRTWLHTLQRVCATNDVPLLFDEVYTGFRMAPGGAQEYYGVNADVVVYGKTLGGGLANGVVCGPSRLMKRFDETRPLRVAYVIGTFSAAPLTLACMAEFLDWVQRPETQQKYALATSRTDQWVHSVNVALAEEDLPMRVDNLTTVWTVLFTRPGRYHWMFQYYLRAEGLSLSWVGTGRCLFSLDFSPSDYEKVKGALLRAARQMKQDGWWDGNASASDISKIIGKEMAWQMVAQRLAR